MKGKSTEVLEQLTHVENTRSNVKKCFEHREKKVKQYARQIKYTSQRHSPTKVTPDIDFADEPVV